MLVGDLIARSLRILRTLDPDESPEPRQYETAIVALNGMANRWEANGINMGWVNVADPSDTLPAPVEAEEALAFNLAMVLRAEYGMTLSPDVIQIAGQGLSNLRRDVYNASPITLATDLPVGRWNIYTDSLGWSR